MAIFKWGNLAFEVMTMAEASKSKNGGVFIFAAMIPKTFTANSWTVYFIDETDDFQTLKNHHLWAEAQIMGATHVHILTAGEKDRKNHVKKLIETHSQRLNHFIPPNPKKEETMTHAEPATQLSETKNKLELLYQYEKHYLGLIKEYKEEIKFANTLQEDLRRERTQFFTQTLKDVIQTMKTAEVDNTVSAQWIHELVASYTKSIDLSGDLAKTHVIGILSTLTEETKREVVNAKLDSISEKTDAQ